MKILACLPPIPGNNTPVDEHMPSLALKFIEAGLKEHDVTTFDFKRRVGKLQENDDITFPDAIRQTYSDLKNLVRETDYLLLSTATFNYYHANRILDVMHEELGELPTVIMGGQHVSARPVESLTESKHVDSVVIGAAFPALTDILDGVKKENIPNIVYRKGNKIKLNRIGTSTLDQNIRLDFKDDDTYIKSHLTEDNFVDMKTLQEIFSLGCVNSCDYCSCTKWGEGGMIYRDIKTITEEIKDAVDRFGVQAVHFVDDSHIISTKKLEDMNHSLKEYGVDVTKTSFLDPLRLDKSRMDILAKNNYVGFLIGRDAFTQRDAALIGRRYNGQIRDVDLERLMIKTFLKKYPKKSVVQISSILPNPYSLKNDVGNGLLEMWDYIDLALKHKKVVMTEFGRLAPYPGTPIRERIINDGLMKDELKDNWKMYEDENFVPYKFKSTYVDSWYEQFAKWWEAYHYHSNFKNSEEIPYFRLISASFAYTQPFRSYNERISPINYFPQLERKANKMLKRFDAKKDMEEVRALKGMLYLREMGREIDQMGGSYQGLTKKDWLTPFQPNYMEMEPAVDTIAEKLRIMEDPISLCK